MNSLPKTVTRHHRSCDLNPGPSAPESSTLTTRLPSHPAVVVYFFTFKLPSRSSLGSLKLKKSNGHLSIIFAIYLEQSHKKTN